MKRLLIVLAMMLLLSTSAQAATFTETQVGGETTGAIVVVLQKYYNAKESTWETKITVTYETRDSANTVIRTANVNIDYNTMTAGQKTYVDGIFSKAITVAKTAASIQ